MLKELWLHLLAYNLIRLLMAQAALDAGLHPREISFKHTVQSGPRGAQALPGNLQRCCFA